LLYYLQLTTFVIWAVVLIVLASATFRMFFGRIKRGDQAKSAMFFVGAVFVLGTSRWLWWPDNTDAWTFVYAMCAGSGVYALVTTWNFRRDEEGK